MLNGFLFNQDIMKKALSSAILIHLNNMNNFNHFSDKIIYGELDASIEYNNNSSQFKNFPWDVLITRRPHQKDISSKNLIFLFKKQFISYKVLFYNKLKWDAYFLAIPDLPIVPRMTRLAFTHENIFFNYILEGKKPSLKKALLKNKHKFHFYRLCQMINLFYDFLPIEYWINIIEEYQETDENMDHELLYKKTLSMKSLLSKCSLSRRFIIIKSFSSNGSKFIKLLNMFNSLEDHKNFKIKYKFKNFDELFFDIYRKHQIFKDGNFKLPQQIPLYKNETIQIKLPYDNHDLIDWSFILDNCLAKFSLPILYNNTLIFGIFIENKLKFAAEIKDHKIVKIEGKKNSTIIPNDVYVAVSKQLELTKTFC